MLLPQDARHNELVCFGIVLFELSFVYIRFRVRIQKAVSLLPTTFLIVSLHLYNDIS